jgi:hypothetical protein
MQKFYPQTLAPWQFQPVHNVFLLILSELGLIGLGLFIWWLWKLFHPANYRNVPPRKFQECSTWNILETRGRRGTLSEHGLNVEQSNISQEGTEENNQYISHNNTDELSRIIILRYFVAILLGLIFIMLFDHYLWDIQQGSLLLWLTAGFIAGMNRK